MNNRARPHKPQSFSASCDSRARYLDMGVRKRNCPIYHLTQLYYHQCMAQSSSGALSLAELYPELSAEERGVVEENIDRYLGVILRISQRIENDSKAMTDEAPKCSEASC